MKLKKFLLFLVLALGVITIQVSAQENSLKKSAADKAKVYTAKMIKTLALSKEQAIEVYRLRYELSLSLQIIHLKFADNQPQMIEFADEAKKDFQIGIKKILKPSQIAILNQYKKDLVALKQVGDKTVELNPVVVEFDF